MGTTTKEHHETNTNKINNNNNSGRDENNNNDTPNNKKLNHYKKNQPTSAKKNDMATLFPKLDSTKHANRIAQRRKAIQYGKNTAGYEAYNLEVPKAKRKHRCMKHPTTPDHTLDIPTKRWQGLIKAWRRALHQYDPPDLEKNFMMEVEEPAKKNDAATTIQDQELEKAQQDGLLVDIPSSRRILGFSTTSSDEVLQQWDQTREEGQSNPTDDNDEFDHVVLNDSDDDLL